MDSGKKVAQSAAMIAVFTLVSKFLGFLREVLIAYKFGSGIRTDTYFVAMTATVIIMTTLGAGLNTTLIPIFTEIEARSGRRGKLKFLNNVLNMVFFITLILAIAGFFMSPYIIRVLAKGFEGQQFDLAVKLNRIGLPIVIFLGFTYVFSGYLHSSEIFGPPAIMGLPYNAVFIVFLLFFAKEDYIEGLMFASVLASSTQFLIQIPAIRHQGYRYSMNSNPKDKYLKKAMVLVIPVVLGSAVQQINTVIDKTLASDLVDGSISSLTYASRINDLIITVFVMAITTVVFPMLSRAFAKKEKRQVKRILIQGVNIILIVTVPATVGILLLSEPIVRLFFQRGAFDELATNMTAGALFFYSLGLIGASLRLMLNKVFYSFQDTKTPMINGIIAVVLNLVLNYLLVGKMKHEGLALATSISTTVTSLFLFIKLRRKIGPIGIKSYISCLIRTGISALIMGLLVKGIYFNLLYLVDGSWIKEMLLLVFAVSSGVLVYFTSCLVLQVREVKILFRSLLTRKK